MIADHFYSTFGKIVHHSFQPCKDDNNACLIIPAKDELWKSQQYLEKILWEWRKPSAACWTVPSCSVTLTCSWRNEVEVVFLQTAFAFPYISMVSQRKIQNECRLIWNGSIIAWRPLHISPVCKGVIGNQVVFDSLLALHSPLFIHSPQRWYKRKKGKLVNYKWWVTKLAINEIACRLINNRAHNCSPMITSIIFNLFKCLCEARHPCMLLW